MDPLRAAGGANMLGQAGSGQTSESERMYNSIKNASKQEKEKRIDDVVKTLIKYNDSDPKKAQSLLVEIKNISKEDLSSVGDIVQERFNSAIQKQEKQKFLNSIGDKYGVRMEEVLPGEISEAYSRSDTAFKVYKKDGSQIGNGFITEFWNAGKREYLENKLQEYLVKEGVSVPEQAPSNADKVLISMPAQMLMKACGITMDDSGTMKFPRGWYLPNGEEIEDLNFFDRNDESKTESVRIEKRNNQLVISVKNEDGSETQAFIDPGSKKVTIR